jgi:CHAT domain-containing protein
MEVDAILKEIHQITRKSNLRHSIELCRQALQGLVKSENEIEWGNVQYTLAKCLIEYKDENRTHNVEQAIFHYQQALQVFPLNRYPRVYAKIHANLGRAFRTQNWTNVGENTEQAIFHYQQALQVYTHDKDSKNWAWMQLNLGIAFVERIRGNNSENKEQAIFHCQQALEVFTPDLYPSAWIDAYCTLAHALKMRVQGDSAENIEQAIFHYQQAAEVCSFDQDPIRWVIIQGRLARTYMKRIYGDVLKNQEQAITCLQKVLEICNREHDPDSWATTHHDIGDALRDSILDVGVDKIEQAIFHYQQALQVHTREEYPQGWARTQNSLGNVYKIRIAEKKIDNIEQAIFHYQQALQVYTRENSPHNWAVICYNLGKIFRSRLTGGRSENLEKTIYYCQLALQVYSREQYPIDWADTNLLLANTFARRHQDFLSDNSQQAVHHCQMALQVYTREDYPEEWSQIQHDLGYTFHKGIGNIEQAIFYYEQALEVRTQQAYPTSWAATNHALSWAFRDRVVGERAENLGHSIVFCQKALQIYTREQHPNDWAWVQNSLGNIFRVRSDDQAQNRIQAIQYYEQALETLTRESDPIRNYEITANMGSLEFQLRNWKQSIEAYEKAADVVEELLDDANSDAGRLYLISQLRKFYTNIAYALIQQGEYFKALIKYEAGKTRIFALQDSMDTLLNDSLDEGVSRMIRELSSRIRKLEHIDRIAAASPITEEKVHRADQLREARLAFRNRIAEHFSKDADKQPQEYTGEVLLALPHNSVLAVLICTELGSAVLLLESGSIEIRSDDVLLLNDFTRTDEEDLFIGSEHNPGWMRNYLHYADGRISKNEWFDSINELTRRLWDKFAGLLHEKLIPKKPERVILLLPGLLNLLPIHAAWTEQENKKQYMIDKYIISYIPSLYFLRNKLNPQKPISDSKAVIVGIKNYQKLTLLENAQIEAEQISALFNVQAVLNEEATVENVTRRAATATYLHLACHGSYGWDGSAFETALYLAGDEPIFVLDIIGTWHLSNARLVTLSACETGIIDFLHARDESIGFPTAFLLVGALGVVSGLWQVEDRSTALLMEVFYKNQIRDSLHPAAALNNAQKWLRNLKTEEIGNYYKSFIRMTPNEAFDAFIDVTVNSSPDEQPFRHPYYWAGFTYVGW